MAFHGVYYYGNPNILRGIYYYGLLRGIPNNDNDGLPRSRTLPAGSSRIPATLPDQDTIYTYIYIYTHIHIYIYIYTHVIV